MKEVMLCSFSLLLSCLCFSQGPGGVQGKNKKKELRLWLDASKGIESSSGKVDAWADRSKRKERMEQSGSRRPSISTSTLNGYQIIEFDGKDDFLADYYVKGGKFESDYTMFIVFKRDGTSRTLYRSLFSNSYGNPSKKNFQIDMDGSSNFRHFSGNSLEKKVTNIAPLSNNWNLFSIRCKKDKNIRSYVNNKMVFKTKIYGPTSQTFTSYLLGTNRNKSKSLKCSIAEVIIYSKAVNKAQMTIISNYLASKYGLTLAEGDLHDMDSPANGNFDHEVAGIGKSSGALRNPRTTGVLKIDSPDNLDKNEFLFWGHNNNELSSENITDFPQNEGIEARINREWRVSEVGEVGKVNVTFNLESLPNGKNVGDLRLLIDTNQDGVFSDESTASGGIISNAQFIGGDVFKFEGVNLAHGQRFTIGTINFSSTPLPIELLDFSAISLDGNVILEWSTATEVNNQYFSIEKSINGSLWEELFIVPGAGNSSTVLRYDVTDEDPSSGTSYYRLKQTDYDGTFTYSKIAPVTTNSIQGEFKMKFNKTYNEVKVEFPEDETPEVVLLTISGKLIPLPIMYHEDSSASVNINILPSGTYLLSVRTGEVSKKFLIKKD